MTVPTLHLGELTPAAFLKDYWQKKPLLIRGAIPDFESPVSPEDLAGLACEEGVTARLIQEEGGDYPWQLRFGPFMEEDFADLPDGHWSLLVQEVDQYVPEVAALRDAFQFIPSWRIDDVMVSYAPRAGGVGPHIDSYDVFLLQARGKRRWQIMREPMEEEVLVPDLDVRILQNFVAEEEWILEPGDLLYLPPRVPHNGIALDDCMTFSVGFRAPSHEEILSGFLATLLDRIDPEARYADPDLRPQLYPGEITPATLARVRGIVRSYLTDEAIDAWFGTHMTESKRGNDPVPPYEPIAENDWQGAVRAGGVLERAPQARFAFTRHEKGGATLFVSGRAYPLTSEADPLALLLTGGERLDGKSLAPCLDRRSCADLITELLNEGFLLM